MEEQLSLYKLIESSVVDGALPEGFSLPKEETREDRIVWADGAMDGVTLYHMHFSKPGPEILAVMEQAVEAAAEKDYAKADELFEQLAGMTKALAIVDELQRFIMEHQESLNPSNLCGYGFRALLGSGKRECVKFALSILEMFNLGGHREVMDAVRTVGLSDEFSLFSLFVMSNWENANAEIWDLAKKVHGWGRVHAVARLEPETEEIKRWLLSEGVHNQVLPAYSALACWEKADAQSVLFGNPTREELSGIRDILGGLLDEGPCPGISELENRDEVLRAFLVCEQKTASEEEDYETVRRIREYLQNAEHADPALTDLCGEILRAGGYDEEDPA